MTLILDTEIYDKVPNAAIYRVCYLAGYWGHDLEDEIYKYLILFFTKQNGPFCYRIIIIPPLPYHHDSRVVMP